MIDEVKLYNFLYPIVKEALEDSDIEINRYKLNEAIENSMFDLRHEIYSVIETFVIKDYKKDIEDDEEDEEDDDEDFEDTDKDDDEGRVVKVGIKKSYDYTHLIMEEAYEMLNMEYNKEIIEYQVDAAMNNKDLYADIRNLFIHFVGKQDEDRVADTRYLMELSERLRRNED